MKKLLNIALVFFLLMTITGCSQSQINNRNTGDVVPPSSNSETETSGNIAGDMTSPSDSASDSGTESSGDVTNDTASQPDSSVEASEEEEFFVSLKDGRPFSEGLAWVAYSVITNNGEEKGGGVGLLTIDGTVIPLELPIEKHKLGSDFCGGYSYINYQKDGRDCYIIIDRDGNTIAESAEDAGYKILCGGDNWYLVKKLIRSMEVSEDHYGIIDLQGNWVNEPTTDFMFGYQQGTQMMLKHGAEYYYLGNGVFHARWVPGNAGRNIPLNVIFDVKTEKLVELPLDSYYESRVQGIHNNTVIWSYTSSYGGNVYRLNEDGTSTEIAVVEKDWLDIRFSEGIVYAATRDGESARFLDISGSVLADFSKYTLNTIDTGCVFTNGYAAVIIRGADNYNYLEIINTSGECSFEPIKLESAIAFIDGKMACRLYGAGDKVVWVDHQGSVTECAFDTFDMLSFSEGYALNRRTFQYVSSNGECLDIHLS